MTFCGGFSCSKNALTALNSLYIVVSVILIGIGVYAKGASIITNLPVVAGIIATGVFLLLVAILGLIGAAKHHQVILFFYMIILFLVFLIQFFVAVACLAMREDQLHHLIDKAWNTTHDETLKLSAEQHFHCCGVARNGVRFDPHNHCSVVCGAEMCEDCLSVIPAESLNVVHVTGGVGLFFSFTEILGIWLAMRFRNLKNPKANPNLFL